MALLWTERLCPREGHIVRPFAKTESLCLREGQRGGLHAVGGVRGDEKKREEE